MGDFDRGEGPPLWLWVLLLIASGLSMLWDAVAWPFRKLFGISRE